jgi:hypothetical protein
VGTEPTTEIQKGLIMVRFQFNVDRTVPAISLASDGTQSSSNVTLGPNGTYYQVDGEVTLNSETAHTVDIQLKDGPLLRGIPKSDYYIIKDLTGFDGAGDPIERW